MKIDMQSPSVSLLPTDQSAKEVSISGSAGINSKTEDRTTFHSNNAAIRTLTSKAMQSPEVRQDKVDSLRQIVSRGEYKIDKIKIAGSIVSNGG